MTLQNTTDCMGYSVFSKTLLGLPALDKIIISTINQYSYCIAEKDKNFKRSLLESDVLLPDGIGIVWASRFTTGNRIQKIAGADLHDYLLKRINSEKGSIFYMGSSVETLSKIEARIKTEYPDIRLGTHSPPYRDEFTSEESLEMIQLINDFKPDVLFVGMTAPKQEKWSHANKEYLNAKIICSIGAVFDFYAGTVERPSKIWIDMGLEWFGRLLNEPQRMWKRYIYYGAIFSFYLLREKLSFATNQKHLQPSTSDV